MNRILKRIAWALLALVILLLAAVVAARLWFDHYLHSEAFRRTLGEGAANALHADTAEFSPLEFEEALVYGDHFQAERGQGGAFSEIMAEQLRAAFDWHGLLRHTVQVDELTVQKLVVKPPLATGERPPVTTEEAPRETGQAAEGPTHGNGWRVDLRQAVINDASFAWADSGGVTGAGLTLTPEGRNAWLIDMQGGHLVQRGFPGLEIENAKLRWQGPDLYINASSLHSGGSHLNITGMVEARRELNLHVKLEGVDITPLVAPDWRAKISGRLAGEIDLRAPLGPGTQNGAGPTSSGSLTLTDGHLTALPILSDIGRFTHTERFREIDLTRAKADFTRTEERLEVRNLVLEAEGLIRVEGFCTVVNGRIDGTFQLGLTPSTLQWIPGSSETVFAVSHDGYQWTSVRLSGPVEHPVDDLAPRLVESVGSGVLHDAPGTVKKAVDGVLDLLTH